MAIVENEHAQALLAQARADPFYKSYLRSAFASGGASSAELLGAVSEWLNKIPLSSNIKGSKGSMPSSCPASGSTPSKKIGGGKFASISSNTENMEDSGLESDTTPGRIIFQLWEPLWNKIFTASNVAAMPTIAPGNAPISTTNSGNTSATNPDILHNFQDARDLAHLVHTCQWMSHEIVCNFAANIAAAVGRLKSQYSDFESGAGDSSTRAARAWTSLQERCAFCTLPSAEPLEIDAVAERALALLRGEAQVACVVMLASFQES